MKDESLYSVFYKSVCPVQIQITSIKRIFIDRP